MPDIKDPLLEGSVSEKDYSSLQTEKPQTETQSAQASSMVSETENIDSSDLEEMAFANSEQQEEAPDPERFKTSALFAVKAINWVIVFVINLGWDLLRKQAMKQIEDETKDLPVEVKNKVITAFDNSKYALKDIVELNDDERTRIEKPVEALLQKYNFTLIPNRFRHEAELTAELELIFRVKAKQVNLLLESQQKAIYEVAQIYMAKQRFGFFKTIWLWWKTRK